MAQYELLGHHAPHGMANEIALGHGQRVEQATDVSGEELQGVVIAPGGLDRAAVAAQVEGNGAIPLGESAHLEDPVLQVAGIAVDEDDREASALLFVVDVEALNGQVRHLEGQYSIGR
jgi:hypothetical protein